MRIYRSASIQGLINVENTKRNPQRLEAIAACIGTTAICANRAG